MSTAKGSPASGSLDGERVAFVGRLAGMSKREAKQLVCDHGGVVAVRPNHSVSLVVVGEHELPLGDLAGAGATLDEETRRAAEQGKLRIINETQLWQRLGLVEGQQNVHRLYTPAMLADLLDVPVSVIRRWHRKGLIVPVREVRRLPYFDFQEIATARRLAELLAAGCSPQAIEKKLGAIAKFLPEVHRPLAQLSVIVEGKELLLRQGDGLLESGGQYRIDFDAEPGRENSSQASRRTLATLMPEAEAEEPESAGLQTPDEMLGMAIDLEDQGHVEAAAEMYRAVLAAAEPQPEVNFYLAELLYRMNDLTAARERYFMAIELDENYVEARANLGCVLAELGQAELAVAAFQGALAYHDQYADVHYHLAKTLDQLGRPDEAANHWRTFLELAPDSPWAEEAEQRLEGS